MTKEHKEIFKKGSKTYFNSSLFFPKAVRDDVFVLYGFVRVADNFVDAIPQQKNEFYAFKAGYEQSLKGGSTGNFILDSYASLSRKYQFDPDWTRAFLHSMELDLTKSQYLSLDETLEYIYGSAEVIGLFMSKILGLPEEAYPAARMQGRAMQYINFIRDISEDLDLGRNYLPLAGSGLENLTLREAKAKPRLFEKFIQDQLTLYQGWQEEANKGYLHIPKRYLIPIKTASDMYNWTAKQIGLDPFVVYQRKVKPGRGKIFKTLLTNWLSRHPKGKV